MSRSPGTSPRRFILFLGDDEVEFLADDALQFAYGGVTAMQDGWLAAQKKKRRHRRAAEAAARRKDGARPLETVSPIERPLHVSDSDTVRNRRRQAGSKAAESLAPERVCRRGNSDTSRRSASSTAFGDAEGAEAGAGPRGIPSLQN